MVTIKLKLTKLHFRSQQSLLAAIFLFIVAFAADAIGQTAADRYVSDIKTISTRMKGLNSFHAKTEVTVKTGNGTINRTSEIKKLGTKTWTKTEGIESVFTTDYIISVLDEHKLINYSEGIGKKNMRKQISKDIIPQLDSVVSKFDSITYKSLSNGDKQYILYSANQRFTKKIIVFTSNLRYKSMEYHYNQNLYKNQDPVNIKFTFWNESPKIDPKIYDLSNYIIKTNKGYVPIKKYSGYQIIENTESLK